MDMAIRQLLQAFGVEEHTKRLQQIGTPTAQKYADAILTSLANPTIPADKEPPKLKYNENNNLHNHGGAGTASSTSSSTSSSSSSSWTSSALQPDIHTAFEDSNSRNDELLRSWWQSSLKQTRKIAQNNYKLRSPSRFRHK